MSARYLLADLSNNNGSVNVGMLRTAGIVGFWHKVSEGQHYSDPYWKTRSAYGRKDGLRVGGYHFARFGSVSDAMREARRFVDTLGKVQRKDLAPVLDYEVSEGLRGTALTDCARMFMHTVHNYLGIWPLFYSYPAFIEGMQAERTIGRGLWLASYGRNDGREHPYRIPGPFKKALAHQFTSNAKVKGVGGLCDLSSAPKLYPLLAHGLRGL
jgi:lysozyme